MSESKPLTPEFLETLLNMHESDTLDFKQKQYPFEGASNDEKGELIKDILAFANAWKTADAHILVGVEEVTGARANVVGVTHHIDDAKFQQLVNSKTNVPIMFSYIAVEIDGKRVGVLRMEQNQNRPVYLKKDFGRLKKNVVYLRRGSSTAEAGVDEIARMGAASTSTSAFTPCIELGFGIPWQRKQFAASIEIFPRVFVDPPLPEEVIRALKSTPFENIHTAPEIVRPLEHSFFGQASPNELREYRQKQALLVPVGLYVKNVGEVVAQDVRAEISVPIVDGLEIVEEKDHPRHRRSGILSALRPAQVMSHDLSLTRTPDKLLLEGSFGKAQPQAAVWLHDVFYVGSKWPLDVKMTARVFADNLPKPIEVSLEIQVSPREEGYDPKAWERLEEEG